MEYHRLFVAYVNYFLNLIEFFGLTYRMMGCCIPLAVVQTMLLQKFFLTEDMMAQHQIPGHVVSSYMSFSLVIYPSMIEILQYFIKR